MNANEKLITDFYSAFRNRDHAGMNDCYAADAKFTDPVFHNLVGNEVKAMWEMLCVRGKDLVIEFDNVKADETSGSADWIATYSFSKTGRKVINKVHAEFTFEDGKIKTHRDHFSFHRWARQALGTTGLLLGWTSALRRKVEAQARKGLNEFMGKNRSGILRADF